MRVLACALVLAGCGSDDEPSACFTGPAYVVGTQFPFVEDNARYPACIPRCDAENASSSLANLPSGACTSADVTCSVAAMYHCANGGGLGREDGMRCACVNGQWSCVIVGPGGGLCPGGFAP